MPGPGAALAALGLAVCAVSACAGSRGGSAVSGPPETREACEARRAEFVRVVEALPDETVATAARADLPVTPLGRAPGSGPVVEVSPTDVVLPGRGTVGGDVSLRVKAFSAWLAEGLPKATAGGRTPLYFAAAAGVEMRLLRAFVREAPDTAEPRLLVRTVAVSRRQDVAGSRGDEIASRLLLESNPAARLRIADEGYRELARCDALTDAVAHASAPDGAPWPARKAALVREAPSCDCAALRTSELALVASAEAHAGVSSLGWLPLAFLRDERCDASMPLRSVEKLVRQIEQFDAEFSARFSHDAVTFDDVITNERLRVTFCDALPGETFAEKAKLHATLYVRVPGTNACEPWSISPLAPGSPMGTLSRAPVAGRPALAFHYWQAAEEIRLFGPAEPGTKPTDSHDYACEETLKLTSMEDGTLRLGSLAWYFSESVCRSASDGTASFSGCVATRAE
ncbi:MAG TPA: hypothetical protein VHE30_23610 [Polyangiaceae bacterium]|nr:hypothetical protein [Polyangiaceae bacterium]